MGQQKLVGGSKDEPNPCIPYALFSTEMGSTETYHSVHSLFHSMATKLGEPFLIEKKGIVMVRPSQPTPSHLLSLSTIDNDPNLEMICQTIYVYVASKANHNNCGEAAHNGNYRASKANYSDNQEGLKQPDPASIIQEGLSKALVYYYPLAGKIKRYDDGKLQVNCTGEGVPFLSATANCTLASLNYLNGIHVDAAKQFVFEFESHSEHGVHPIMIQVTRFACGGFTVGMGLSHSVCDGFGSAQFFRAVGELASGKSEPSVKPVWERERLVGTPPQGPIKFPFDMASLATSPYLLTADLVHESFDVNAESIRKLKASMMKENNSKGLNVSLTTLDVLGAYIWRSKFRALDMNLEGKTNFSLAIGIRNVLHPPLPEGYYGNSFIGSNVVVDGKDLCEWPLSKVARMIKESKGIATKIEYVCSYLGMMEQINQENKKIGGSGASMILTDWRHMGLLEGDFGWKYSVNVVPVPWKMFGYVDLCIFLPPFSLDPSMKDGLRVLVCLPRAAMDKFRAEMASLNL